MTSIPLASSSVKAKPAAPSASEYTFSQKWGDDPFTGMGHTQLPNALVEYGARIGLTMTECWLVTCVLRFKYTPADPYPSQARLGAIVGKREETVRHVLKAVERKGLMRVTKVRGDLGHFTHSVYNFAPLRAALNEAYHCDHPDERPILAPPSATELCAEIQRFHSATTSEQIKEENERVKKALRADRLASQPGMPKKSREGFVYLLQGESSLYKIGKARDVNKRVLEISPKMPFDPILLHTIKCDDYTAAEAGIHSQFNHLRVNGEWFRLGTDDVSMIQSIACYRDGEWGWL